MRERERIDLNRFKEEEAAREEAERIEREKPLREAEDFYKKTATDLAKLQRERILTQPDDELKLSPELVGKKMNIAEAKSFNAVESKKFMRETPDYYPCKENFNAIISYLERNGIVIADAATFKFAYARLREYGLIVDRPTPEPQQTTVPAREEPKIIPEQPKTFAGFDPVTGRPKDYTAYEVDRMSADEYRRCFRLYGEDKPRFVDPRL